MNPQTNPLFSSGSVLESKFMIMKMVDEQKSFKEVSVIKLYKALNNIVPGSEIKKLRNGTLLIKVMSKAHFDNLLSVTVFCNEAVRVEPHRGLNVSRGVISSYELLYCDENEIKEELASQNVIEIKRLTSRKQNRAAAPTPTPAMVLTFDTPILPRKVNIGYLVLGVRLYIPSPVRCFKCMKFAHTAMNCSSQYPVCGLCGLPRHDGECTTPLKCVNCSEGHSSWARECRVFINEKKIKEIMTKEKLTYAQAKRRILPSRTNEQSYAQAASISNERERPLESLLTRLVTAVEALSERIEKLERVQRVLPEPTEVPAESVQTPDIKPSGSGLRVRLPTGPSLTNKQSNKKVVSKSKVNETPKKGNCEIESKNLEVDLKFDQTLENTGDQRPSSRPNSRGLRRPLSSASSSGSSMTQRVTKSMRSSKQSKEPQNTVDENTEENQLKGAKSKIK